MNRNKRWLALDLKDDADRAAFHRLARDADVVVENYRPGVAERLGIDYETLRALNPRLIYALGLRLRADRPVRAAAGLRPDRAGRCRA